MLATMSLYVAPFEDTTGSTDARKTDLFFVLVPTCFALLSCCGCFCYCCCCPSKPGAIERKLTAWVEESFPHQDESGPRSRVSLIAERLSAHLMNRSSLASRLSQQSIPQRLSEHISQRTSMRMSSMRWSSAGSRVRPHPSTASTADEHDSPAQLEVQPTHTRMAVHQWRGGGLDSPDRRIAMS